MQSNYSSGRERRHDILGLGTVSLLSSAASQTLSFTATSMK